MLLAPGALRALAGVSAPLAGRAQPAKKVCPIGHLSAPTRASVEHALDSFLHALRKLGWVDDRDCRADGDVNRLPALAAGRARRKVDLLVAAGHLGRAGGQECGPHDSDRDDAFERAGRARSRRQPAQSPGGNVTGTALTAGLEIFGKQSARCSRRQA